MEYFGVFAFILCIWLLAGPSHPSNMKKLQRRVRALEKSDLYKKRTSEVADMSRLIEELKGKWCIVDSDELLTEKVRICDVDAEWVKIEYPEKKTEPEKLTSKLIRIDSIDSIEILESNTL